MNSRVDLLTLNENRFRFPVLVIDDDPVFQSLIAFYLEDSGYRITLCHSAEEGLKLLKRERFMLVLSDWNFPGMDGLQLCTELRAIESEYHYFIFLTGNASNHSIKTGLEVGADDYIKKGASKEEIIARLDAGLRIIQQQEWLIAQRKEIEQQAITDALTGCFNRRHLMNVGEREIKRALRYQQDVSVIMCDIDYFKRINDTYGHQAGDVVLAKCGRYFAHHIREGIDMVFRYGGEEFVILLPNVGLVGAGAVAEKFRLSVAAKTVIYKTEPISFTCSFGIASLKNSNPKTLETMLMKADKHLYHSKNEGRNRVTSSLSY